jgi:hypothetical protein
MRTAALPTLIALATLGTGNILAQAQSLDRSSEMLDSMTRQLKLCAEITDTNARLACFGLRPRRARPRPQPRGQQRRR